MNSLLMVNTCFVSARPLSHKRLYSEVYPARRVVCYLTLPRPHSSRWPADCWVWPASAVGEAVPAAVSHSTRAADRFTTSPVSAHTRSHTHTLLIVWLLPPHFGSSVPVFSQAWILPIWTREATRRPAWRTGRGSICWTWSPHAPYLNPSLARNERSHTHPHCNHRPCRMQCLFVCLPN